MGKKHKHSQGSASASTSTATAPVTDAASDPTCTAALAAMTPEQKELHAQLVEQFPNCKPRHIVQCVYSKKTAEKCKAALPKVQEFWEKHTIDAVTPEEMQDFLEMDFICHLAGDEVRAQDGSSILFAIYGNWDPSRATPEQSLRCMSKFLDTIVERNPSVIQHGLTMVVDESSLGYKNFDPSTERKFIGLMQDTYPVRIKHFIMVDAGYFLNFVIKCLKPFLSKKTQERLQPSAGKMEKLSKWLTPACVVERWGGTNTQDWATWRAGFIAAFKS